MDKPGSRPPSFSNLPEQDRLTSNSADPSLANLPKHPEDQSTFRSAEANSLFPQPPEESEPTSRSIDPSTSRSTDPSLSNLPGPPKMAPESAVSLLSNLSQPSESSISNLPEPSESSISHLPATSESADPLISNLPEPPEEPLQSDCCGTGCSPCVFDIYQEDLERWRELAALSPEERAIRMSRGRGKVERHTAAQAHAALTPEEYQSFRVVGVEQVSSDAFVFEFGLPKDRVLGVGTGQHAVLRVQDSDGHTITRQYTPISRPDQQGSFSVLIKVYEKGKMSRHIREWRLGSKADWRGPFGDFTYKPNQFARVGLLACGTGIAPMVQLSRAIVENEDEETFVHCLYGCRTQQDVLMKTELDHFSTYWNFTITYALSNTSPQSVAETPGKMAYGDRIHYGRIDEELIAKELGVFLKETGEMRSTVLICGTKSFNKDMINFLHKAGRPRHSYFKF